MCCGKFWDHLYKISGVREPCERCNGLGRRLYSQTCTWHGGVGGNVMTMDVCDRCWGTGDKHRQGTNLRKLKRELDNLRFRIEGLEK